MGSSRKRGGRGLSAVGLATLLAAGMPLGAYASTSVPFPGAVNIVPQSVVGVGGCIPFSLNTSGFSGFVYQNVPSFTVEPGTRFAFDLARENNVDIRRDIYFAVGSTELGGVRALEWTQVVSTSQLPESPRGNWVVGDYELVYSAEETFDFPGGWLVVGFGGWSAGDDYPDAMCTRGGVLVHTTADDPSGHFHGRFAGKSLRTTDDLRTGPGTWNTDFLGGIVIFVDQGPSVRTVRSQLLPGDATAPLRGVRNGVVPIALLSEPDFDVPGTVDPPSLRFGASGSEESLRRCVPAARDIDGDGLADLVCHFDVGTAGLEAGAGSAVVTGIAEGVPFEATVTFRSAGH